jgi:hypothetical protein
LISPSINVGDQTCKELVEIYETMQKQDNDADIPTILNLCSKSSRTFNRNTLRAFNLVVINIKYAYDMIIRGIVNLTNFTTIIFEDLSQSNDPN